MIIGERVKDARHRLGISQIDLSNQTGISKSYISNIEKGKNEPSFNFIVKVSEAMGVSLDWLVFGKGLIFSSGSNMDGVSDQDIEIMAAINRLPENVQRFFWKSALALIEEFPDSHEDDQ